MRDTISIHQADRDNLEKIRRLALYCGLRCSPVRLDKEIDPFTGGEGKVYTFSVSTSSLSVDLLIKSDQKSKYKCKKGAVNKTVSVREVQETDIEEEVYCCTENETHTMVIDNFILTGQCWWVEARPQSYEDMDMFKDTYVFSHPTMEMPSFPFVFMFDRAMLGGGVGFGNSQEYVVKFGEVRNTVDLSIHLDENHPDWFTHIIPDVDYDKIEKSISVDKLTGYTYIDI